MNRPLHTLTAFLILLTFLPSLAALHPSTLNLPPLQEPSPTPTSAPLPSPADIINAVNAFRLANGLNALLVHPVLMQVAAQQANALAASEGAVGHQRPCGMTLGQQLLSLGFPSTATAPKTGWPQRLSNKPWHSGRATQNTWNHDRP